MTHVGSLIGPLAKVNATATRYRSIQAQLSVLGSECDIRFLASRNRGGKKSVFISVSPWLNTGAL
jgi:hypothetical protein